MIHYDLHCGANHRFDGWFKDSAAFDDQANRGLLECPVCGDDRVVRAMMAPAIPKKGRRPPAQVPVPESTPAPTSPPPAEVAAQHIPDHVRAMLQKLRAEVEKNCDYVGDTFAAEARRIHEGETERRAIYGEATPDEAEALAEDGIDIARIPWVPRADG